MNHQLKGPLMRPEQDIFDELAKLCTLPGYIHAISYLCFRDNMIRYEDELKSEDMQHLFSRSRLIRTETSTLIGLLLRKDIDYTLPDQHEMQEYITRTEALLEEIHNAMSAPFWATFATKAAVDKDFNPFTAGAMLREPIFYGGESAYSFQYRDLAPRKYAKDDSWLRSNKGFSIQAARDVVHAVGLLQDKKSIETLSIMRTKPPEEWTFLPGDTFSAQEVANYTGLDIAIVTQVLAAFTVPDAERNEQFAALNDFNSACAFPLISPAKDTYILFHRYSLVEALYESPFYWMCADRSYVNTAMQNRGEFAENFSVERLALVFGNDKVFSRVDIFGPNRNKMGEIDTLVLFGNRAIVVQVKSKRLTIESRKGNDLQIRDDFKKSIQDSYDQAYKCAKLLGDANYSLKDGRSNEIVAPLRLKDIYIMCVVSDHYPALSFQARQFLKLEVDDAISPPFILDVFTLDAMTEMLDSPLQFLSYVDRRSKYHEKLMASHELTILSYHLKQNLWLSEEHGLVMLEDDISADLDLAMIARREGIPGKRTPDGILTRMANTTLGRLIKEIGNRPDPATIDLGYTLLTLSEDTIIMVSNGINELARRARFDRKNHDLTIGLGQSGGGLTVHCNNDPIEIAAPTLERHCYARKYTQRAKSWFGICIHPIDTSIRFGLNLDFSWECSEEMEALTQEMAKPRAISDLLHESIHRKKKIGRNDPCPCGSGRKYKRCCISQ